MSSYTHIIHDQDDYDKMIDSLYRSERESQHLLYIHAHGSNDKKNYDVLKSVSNKDQKYIFITDLKDALDSAFQNNKKIYIIAISCYWNEKYKKEYAGENKLPIPTISFASGDVTRLPTFESNFISMIHNLPPNFDYQYMMTWFQNLKKRSNYLMNLNEVYIDGVLQTPSGYVLKYRDERIDDDDSWESLQDEDQRIWNQKRY